MVKKAGSDPGFFYSMPGHFRLYSESFSIFKPVKLLVIEDQKDLLASITQYLGGEGYICESAADYDKALEKIDLYNYDCILVDITLPGGTGLQLVRELKSKRSQAGIIIISARNSLDDKLTGLELGADDYLTKPFHLSELNARIRALLRRKNFDSHNEILLNEIKIATDSRKVFVHGAEVQLTGKEYQLLLYFISNKGKVLTKAAIAEHLWGDDSDQLATYDFIYAHIKNLRKKLVEKGCRDYIQTVYGAGYIFDPL